MVRTCGFHTKKLLYTDPCTCRNLVTQTLLHTAMLLHTVTLLHTNALAHTHTHRRLYTRTPLHTEAVTHRWFYTQMLLHTGTFTHTLLHTDAFTYKHLIYIYTKTLVHTDAFTHRHLTLRRLYTQTLLYTKLFTHTKMPLQTQASTHRDFYTQNFEHAKNWILLQFLADQASFRANGLLPRMLTRNFTTVFADRPCERIAAQDVNSQFCHNFCRSTLISCEKVACRGASVAPTPA